MGELCDKIGHITLIGVITMTDTYIMKYRPLYKAFKACYKEYGKEEAKKIVIWILDKMKAGKGA